MSKTSPKALADLISDWGGFERLVAQLHESGDVKVEHNVTLKGRSGASRQVDVLLRHTQGLYEHLIVVECKYWKARIERAQVDALAMTCREIGASKGVIFSTKGFQKGAIEQARAEGISLFLLREPTPEEWGLPGRHIDVWLHFIALSLGNFSLPGAIALWLGSGLPPVLNLTLCLDEGERRSQTKISARGVPEVTLENLLERIARVSAAAAYQPVRMDFGGKEEGEHRVVIPVSYAPETATRLFVNGLVVIAPKIQFDLGIQIRQSHLEIDRHSGHAFVLAVENCIDKTVRTALRRTEDLHTTVSAPLARPRPEDAASPSDPVWQNGSMITSWLKNFVDFSSFEGVARSGQAVDSRPVTLKLSDHP
ncbi:hypothetical protein J2789_004320 [Variovorax paradoxus]|uniref:restriction endonuclease n=1 Tax=Variovorax atrisoli TaxID=3394203 RepID=UPI00119A9644|nr:restriction endonuclease [Variovorax paradoxus]MDR6521633.1 hypothetical protein [Variovorax paradoxus]